MRHQEKPRVHSRFRSEPPGSPSQDRSPPAEQPSVPRGVQAAEDRATGALLLRLLFSSGAVTPPHHAGSASSKGPGDLR